MQRASRVCCSNIAKGLKRLFLGYCEGPKAYQSICLKMKKIIKSLDMVFFEDKTHLEDCPSGRVEKPPVVKIDISLKSNVDELDATATFWNPMRSPTWRTKRRPKYRLQNPRIVRRQRNSTTVRDM